MSLCCSGGLAKRPDVYQMERMLCGTEQGQRFETTGEQAPPDNSDEHYESAVDLDRCEMEH